MEYVLATILCAVLALVGAVVWGAEMLPAGEGSFGAAKALPVLIAVFFILLFGVGWFPITALVFFWKRRKRRGSHRGSLLAQIAPLIVSVLVFVPALRQVYSISREEMSSKHLESLASNPRVHAQELMSAIDRFCAESRRGLSETRDTQVIQRLGGNRSTPPEVLGHLADSLDERSGLLSGIAENPNCPPKVLARLRSLPSLAPYLACNPEAPVDLLAELATSQDSSVKVFVARNPQTPRPALERLSKDPDENVRKFANMNLNGVLGDFAFR